jgi:hypothetical protein
MPEIANGSISVIYLLFVSVIGVAAGGVACLVLQKSWDVKVALFDALLTALTSVGVAYAVMELGRYGSAPYSPASFVLPIAICCVVLRHLLRLTF